MKSLLLFEFWGLGDAVIATSVIRRALEDGLKVEVVCTKGSMALLERSYPNINYHCFDLPWKSYSGKYNFWAWDWLHLIKLVYFLFMRQDDAVISVRPDPRDHFLMRLTRCKKRGGVKRGKYHFSLTHAIKQSAKHRVQDWNTLYSLVFPQLSEFSEPYLINSSIHSKRKIVFHVGARIAVRRLNLGVYEKLVILAKSQDWEVHVVADPDGYGSELKKHADFFYDNISLRELQEIFEGMSGFIGNDSAPAHIAAAMRIRTLVFFGPTSSEWFRPWGNYCLVVQEHVCPFRPCFDYCKLDKPICMEVLSYDRIRNDFLKFLAQLETNKY